MIELRARKDIAERLEDGVQVFAGIPAGEGDGEFPKGAMEELLDDLGADDPGPFLQGRGDQASGDVPFAGVTGVEGIDENVRVEKRFSAQSSRPAKICGRGRHNPGKP